MLLSFLYMDILANVCKIKTKLSLDAVCSETEHLETDKLFRHRIDTVNSKGKHWFVTEEMQFQSVNLN